MAGAGPMILPGPTMTCTGCKVRGTFAPTMGRVTRAFAHDYEAEVPGLACQACGEVTYDFEALARADREIARLVRAAGDTSEKARDFLRKVDLLEIERA